MCGIYVHWRKINLVHIRLHLHFSRLSNNNMHDGKKHQRAFVHCSFRKILHFSSKRFTDSTATSELCLTDLDWKVLILTDMEDLWPQRAATDSFKRFNNLWFWQIVTLSKHCKKKYTCKMIYILTDLKEWFICPVLKASLVEVHLSNVSCSSAAVCYMHSAKCVTIKRWVLFFYPHFICEFESITSYVLGLFSLQSYKRAPAMNKLIGAFILLISQ